MGKSKKKDRLYVSAKEYSIYNYGGQEYKDKEERQVHRLPFDCCSITLQPAVDPVAIRHNGKAFLFDIVSLVPFLRKFKKNPITGLPMTTKEMIRVHLHKNSEGPLLSLSLSLSLSSLSPPPLSQRSLAVPT
jgi:peptidyl-prolyl cis-trans isomerase-like protein 2